MESKVHSVRILNGLVFYYVDLRQTLFALNLKFFKSYSYENYNTKGIKRKVKEETKEAAADEKTEEDAITFCFQFNPVWTCTTTIYKITNAMNSMPSNPLFPKNPSEASLNKNKFCTAKYIKRGNVMIEFWTLPLLNFFPEGA